MLGFTSPGAIATLSSIFIKINKMNIHQMYPLNLMKSLTLTLFLDDRQFLIQLSFTKPFMARVKVD